MTVIIGKNGSKELDLERFSKNIDKITANYPHLEVEAYKQSLIDAITAKDTYTKEQVTHLKVLKALENIDIDKPDWTYIAAHTYLETLYSDAAYFRGYDEDQNYGSLYELLTLLTKEGIYNPKILSSYTKEEIDEMEKVIDPERDKDFNYIAIKTLADRYLATDHDNNIYELPQERFAIIALTIMLKEKPENRLELAKEAYWALSNRYMTVATPTLNNAGKSYGQLSSCFIDTMDDSLDGIFMTNHDVARLSKSGGGIGVYLGKIRSRGSDIKGFKGISSGVIPWMKQLNNTAVSVDQLGQRQGAIAVYLDVWHKDIFSFLDSKLNNGDERMRTHDLFTGVCLPDLFMEMIDSREDWYIFDPHTIDKVMGYRLEDSYDEEKGRGSFRNKYFACVDAAEAGKFGPKGVSYDVVPAIEIFKRIMKSQLETGTPYMFYRDTVNRDNPNKHAGMIYSSNLCTEIMQNMSATTISEETTVDGKIIITKTPGDFVVCNLSSISLAAAVTANVLERLIAIQVRMLDNVIDLNTIEVLQAQVTNQKYRAIGLGTFGWHHLLALKGIKWESQEAVDYADELYSKIAYLTIKASMDLAVEKGAYPAFPGSDWSTGDYFDRKGYNTPEWQALKAWVMKNGMRNGYLIAVAPNSSTSILAGSTASIDPIFQIFYSEEKKNYKIPVTAPDLNPETYEFYQSAYTLDQRWSVRQNAARQKHIDQAVSFNIYVPNNIPAKKLLEVHRLAWDSGMKTTYYVRSTSTEIEECEWCAS
ncbi:MAG: ribonucleoside-diphosphate reductase, alpha subunit [Bacillales bacterium]|jgi:ribonucleoside-diphosphate reductase alpha chain|nr:ribonucleoside-diphosphate reductase, alpha subunit [Bacillales bacterium]